MSTSSKYGHKNETDTRMKNGEKLVLRYRVLVHAGSHLDAGIAGEFEKYKKIK